VREEKNRREAARLGRNRNRRKEKLGCGGTLWELLTLAHGERMQTAARCGNSNPSTEKPGARSASSNGVSVAGGDTEE
jgi:hypothetical protein